MITFPLRARYFKIIRFPKLTVLALLAVVLAFHVYLPFKYQVVAVPSTEDTGSSSGGGGGGRRYRIGLTKEFRAHLKAFDAVSTLGKFLFSYFPLLAGLALSAGLVVALRRHSKAAAGLQEVKDGDGGDGEGGVKVKVKGKGKAALARRAERQLAMTIWVRQ